MSYENPPVPHEVNVARASPVLEFLRLAAALLLILGVLSVAVYFTAGHLARLIPFETERSWVGERVLGVDVSRKPARGKVGADPAQVQRYLQRLADELATGMDLPQGMRLQAHFVEMPEPNAFATLGGHIVVTRRLYELMPSENALSMVIAHEIAHVKARDPISTLGGGASLALLLVLAGGDIDALGPQMALLVQKGYSRDAERRADDEAVAALRRKYGHAGGAAAVFEQLSKALPEAVKATPNLLSTHPTDAERIAHLKAAAAGWDAARQPLRPIAP